MRIFPTTPPEPTWDTTDNTVSIPVVITTDLASGQSVIGIIVNAAPHVYVPNYETVLTWEAFIDDYADYDGHITHVDMLAPLDVDAHILGDNTHARNTCINAIWKYANDVVLKALLTQQA